MSANAHSLADLDRRIERLEGRADGDSAERAEALREVRAYAAANRLLPETAQTRRQRQPQGEDAPVLLALPQNQPNAPLYPAGG
ncbi:MAG: hypothetical protein ACLSGS_02200, partial [Adlercreutzia sp.]